MIIIPIKLSSIKLNPNYNKFGNYKVLDKIETRFKYEGKPLDWITKAIENDFNNKYNLNEFLVTQYGIINNDEIACEGVIHNPHNIPKQFFTKGFKIETDNRHFSIPYWENQQYFFKYTKVKLKCFGCNTLVNIYNIINIDSFNKCPECESLDSFVDYKYEKIEDALKRKENKK